MPIMYAKSPGAAITRAFLFRFGRGINPQADYSLSFSKKILLKSPHQIRQTEKVVVKYYI